MIRGGFSLICKRCTEANNKFLKSYDANKPTSYIIYLDANSLYGLSMMQLLPTETFLFASVKMIKKCFLFHLKSSFGYQNN